LRHYHEAVDFNYAVAPALIVLAGIVVAWLATRRILSLPGKSYPAWRKVMERIVLSLVGLAAVLLAASSGFNAIALHRFRSNPPGRMYQVNGRQMRIACTGSGLPTIMLDAGLGNDGLIWGGVQPALAKTTRVCSYDRAGFGWSDALPPPRDADHIADELHGLLAAAKIGGPTVLMGAFDCRDVHSRLRDAVSGRGGGTDFCGRLDAVAGAQPGVQGCLCQEAA
jgi:hypothetical protein